MTFPENAPSANPVFYRTYSRSTNGIESWDDVVNRTIQGITELGKLTEAESALLREQQQQLTALPSGRWLWVGGTEWILDPKNFYGAYNCSSQTIDSWQAFGQIMNLAMQGCGTGADLAYCHITKIPIVTTAIKIVEVTEIGSIPKESRIEGTYLCSAGDSDRPDLQQLVVGDSRRGWVDAYQTLLELSSSGAKEIELIVDLRNIRPKGERLKGFGGVANPAKLPGLFARCAEILGEAIGQKLTAEQCCLLIDEAALVVVAGSIRRCIASGSRVATISGMKQIQDIKIGELVLTSSGEYKPVVNFFDQGVQDVVEVITSVGSIQCTANHRVAVFDSLNTYRWKQARDLTPQDRMISVPHKEGLMNSTSDQAYLLGYYLGNGHADTEKSKARNGGGGCVVFAMSRHALETGVEGKIVRILAQMGYVPTTKTDGNQVSVCVYRKELAEYLLPFKSAFSEPKIPAFVWEASADIRAAFLAGLMDSDGSEGDRNVVLNSSYVGFLRQVQKLYLSLGIATTLHERPDKTLKGRDKVYRGCHWLHVRGIQSQVVASERINPHTIKNKIVVKSSKKNGLDLPFEFAQQAIASGWSATTLASTRSLIADSKGRLGVFRNPNWDTLLDEGVVNPIWLPIDVIAIAPAGEVCTYDIEVEGDHEFVCEGLLVHNSAGMRQFDESTPLLKENLWVEDADGKWSIDPKRDALRMANHTRVFHRKPTLEECISSVRSQYYSGEGAIQWAGEAEKRAQGKGRYGLNPCVTADTWVHTENGCCQVKDLIGKQRRLYVNGSLHETTEEGFFHSGVKPVFRLSTVEGYELRLTDNHAVLKVVDLQDKSYEWTEAQNLVPGDRIRLHNHRSAEPWRGMNAEIDYLRSLFDLQGEVQDGRIALPLKGSTALLGTQRSLARLGIISALCMNSGELLIEGDNLFWFQKTIGFRDSLQVKKLSQAILNCNLELEDFTATVTSLVLDGTEDVYDCTVPSAGCFDANGIFAHNCGEIIGENFMCNLSEIHLNLIDPLDFEAQRDAFTAGAIAVSALLNHKFDQERYAKSREEDPIVGVSFTGLFDFFVNLFGAEWLKWWEAGRPESWIPEDSAIEARILEKFPIFDHANRATAFRNIEAQYLDYWRMIVEDVIKEYCDRHQIKCPNRTTVVQPAGTKSLLTGASPGWHPPKAQQFIRRITMGAYDPVALACIDFGYNIIPSQEAKDETGNLLDDPFDPRVQTWLVEIPTKVCWADIPGVQDIDISKFTALAQFDFYMQVQQNYTTHNTSATIELREPEIEALGTRIYEAIANDEGYISAAILGRFDDIKTYPRLPFEPITAAEYEELHSQVLSRRKVSDFHAALTSRASAAQMEDLAQGPAGCDGDKCLIGDVSKPQENK